MKTPTAAARRNILLVDHHHQYLIIGGGNMGVAFATGLIEAGHSPSLITVVEKSAERRAYVHDELLCLTLPEAPPSIEKFSVALLCVKPQDAHSAANDLAGKFNENQLLISVMAGISIPALQNMFKHEMVVRCMPNLPASIGVGVTVYSVSPKVTLVMSALAKQLMDSVGVSISAEREEMLDAATAICGSGPGYLAYFFDQMIEIAKKFGFSPEQSNQMVVETVAGTAKYLQISGLSSAELQDRVTSPSGTTAAAIQVLEDSRFREIFRTAIEAAEARSRELGKSTTVK